MQDQIKFVIPDRDDDLLMERSGTYMVTNVDDLQTCIENFREFEGRYSDEGPECMLKFFDSLFFMVKKPTSADDVEVKDANLLLNLAETLTGGMADVFNYSLEGLPFMIRMSTEKLQKEEIQMALKSRTSLMMHLYLLWRVNSRVESLWIKWHAQQRMQMPKNRTKGKGKKGVVREEENDDFDSIPIDVGMEDVQLDGISRWPQLRLRICEILCHILSAEAVDAENGTRIRNAIRFLWSSGIVDPSFIKTISRIFLDWLNSEEHRFKQSTWLLQACRILVPLVVGFGQSEALGALILEKTIHLEWIKDSFPFIEAIQRQTFDQRKPNLAGDVLGKKNALDGVLVSMVVQMAAFRPQELTSSNNNTTRALVCFIQTISARAPHVMIKYMGSMVKFLREDPYQLRGAVLTAMAELILSEEMTDQRCKSNPLIRDARAMFFDTLQKHLRDQATQIRAKVVSLWRQLAEEKRIPRSVIDAGIIDYIGERLEDKQVLVRKPAIAFMSTFLRNNPYGHDFSFEANKDALQQVLIERDGLLAENPEFALQRRMVEQFGAVKSVIAEEFLAQLKQDAEEVENEEIDDPDVLRGIFPMLVVAAKSRNRENLNATVTAVLQFVRLGKYVDKGLNIELEKDVLIKRLLEVTQERFIQCEMINAIGDDTKQLQAEEQRADWIDKVKKTNANIAHLKNKIHLELALADTLQSALRGALQGDAAELKEAINFIIECKNFEIRNVDDVIKQVFALIWRNSIEIQREVLSAARRMLLSQNSQRKVADEATATRMIDVLKDTNEVEFLCISEVIKRLFTAEDGAELSGGVLNHLFTSIMCDSEKAKESRLPALKLLSIFARIAPADIRQNLRLLQGLITMACDDDASEATINNAVAALGVVAECGTDTKREGESDVTMRPRRQLVRIPANDSLFTDIDEHFISRFLSNDCENYGHITKLTLEVYFNLCGQSGRVVCGLMAKIIWYLQRATRVLAFYEAESSKASRKEGGTGSKGEFLAEALHHWRVYHDKILERTLTFCGELAQQIFIYIDEVMVGELKRMQEIISSEGIAKKSTVANSNSKKKNQSKKDATKDDLDDNPTNFEVVPELTPRVLTAWEADSACYRGLFQALHPKIQSSKAADNAGQDDSGAVDMAGAQLFNQLLPPHILGRIAPLVNFCVRANSTSKTTRAAAATAFAKMVPLAQQYAKRASFMLTLLMTASQNPMIRENLLIAMVDIYEFVPISFDNYQAELFNMCRDVNACVRETALLVLLHVTADGLVQNRSGVADIARCFVDPVEDIQIMAKMFFAELSTKKNMIFNAMPDFLSRLTRNNNQVSFEDFKKIMTPLLEYLEALESEDLVLRVLQRIESIDSESLIKNEQLPLYLIWVLNMVAKNEKSFSKIRDHRKAIERHLHVEGVWELFSATIEKLRKIQSSNAHFTDDLERLYEEMTKIYEKAIDTAKTIKKATAFQRRVKQGGGSRATPKKIAAVVTKQKRAFLEDLEEEDSENSD
ncbi:unnamed protein product, partial [Mesorhabditis belari]|uniref:Condensin complex subunit 1 C-terminal domain-containing protein n=1 Tax=Mesorhabditis belari TaxID=2138241 RepID=A0AAF3J7Y1_9BILA